jgi:hypothetical protein
LYLPELDEPELDRAIVEACDFMGFELKAVQGVQVVEESDIPEEALDGFRRFNAGFDVFHSFADEH